MCVCMFCFLESTPRLFNTSEQCGSPGWAGNGSSVVVLYNDKHINGTHQNTVLVLLVAFKFIKKKT